MKDIKKYIETIEKDSHLEEMKENDEGLLN
jgi:hypothetical protein